MQKAKSSKDPKPIFPQVIKHFSQRAHCTSTMISTIIITSRRVWWASFSWVLRSSVSSQQWLSFSFITCTDSWYKMMIIKKKTTTTKKKNNSTNKQPKNSFHLERSLKIFSEDQMFVGFNKGFRSEISHIGESVNQMLFFTQGREIISDQSRARHSWPV